MPAAPADRLLRVTAALLWAAAGGVVAAAIWLPYRLPLAVDEPVAARSASRPATTAAVAFVDLLDLNLRQPLMDAPPKPGPIVGRTLPQATPAVRLAGIVDEPGHAFAVFVTATGATEVRTVGQRSGPAEVVAISPAAVTVRIGGQLSTLKLPAMPKG